MGKLEAYVRISLRHSGWRKVLQGLLSLLPFLITGLTPMRALAQDKRTPTDLFDERRT